MKPTTSKTRINGKPAPSAIVLSGPAVGAESRLEWIAHAAYYKAAARGFAPGQDTEDWLEAEAEFEEREEQ